MKSFLLFLILTVSLFSKTYEDAEDKKVTRWHILKPSSMVKVETVHDSDIKSQVISLQGEGTINAYLLKIDETFTETEEKKLSWQMKYSEDFVILVSLETKRGRRYLIYTPSDENSYMEYGLGKKATNGKWHNFTRDLEKDLKYFDSRNSIVKINSFVIRGSGRIDNIETLSKKSSSKIDKIPKNKKDKPLKPHKVKKKKSIKQKSKRKEQQIQQEKNLPIQVAEKNHKSKNVKKDGTPQIIIEGDNPLYLEVDEKYEEPGIKAEDKEDGDLTVTSSENIDEHKEGRYVVIYMATDSDGNSAIDKRLVVIGEEDSEKSEDEEEDDESDTSSKEKKSNKKSDENSSSIEDDSEDFDAEYKLEERELEIAEWEKELQLREKEIQQKEEQAQLQREGLN